MSVSTHSTSPSASAIHSFMSAAIFFVSTKIGLPLLSKKVVDSRPQSGSSDPTCSDSTGGAHAIRHRAKDLTPKDFCLGSCTPAFCHTVGGPARSKICNIELSRCTCGSQGRRQRCRPRACCQFQIIQAARERLRAAVGRAPERLREGGVQLHRRAFEWWSRPWVTWRVRGGQAVGKRGEQRGGQTTPPC